MSAHVDLDYTCVYIAEDLESYVLMHYDKVLLFPPRHALDIREHYERKLERANNLYMELSAVMLQLELKEKELQRYK